MNNADNSQNKYTRCKVLGIESNGLFVGMEQSDQSLILKLDLSQQYLLDTVWEGATLNLLNSRVSGTEISAQRIILQPDYLIDISQLANCFKDYGTSHPLFYLYKLIEPHRPSAYALLGNTVNQFFDDAIQNSNKNYKDSLMDAFRQDAVQFLTTDKLPEIYFSQIEGQFRNIHACIEHDFPKQTPPVCKENGLLEPSFICPQLGIQGRLDFLELDIFDTGDDDNREASIIELKSGKFDEYRKCHKIGHYVQLQLYAALLHYNQGIAYDHIHSYLLYSKYPKLLNEPMITAILDNAMEVRNQIIGILHEIETGQGEKFFTRQIVEAIGASGNTLWEVYEKPKLLELVDAIELAPAPIRHWFLKQLQYIVTEDGMARLGCPSNPTDQGSSMLWRSTFEQKVFDGELICNLTPRAFKQQGNGDIIGVTFDIRPLQENLWIVQQELSLEEVGSPNFRLGDEVLFYHMNQVSDNATNQVIFRGNIAYISNTELQVELRQSLRHGFFTHWEGDTFACEHDKVNNNMANSCRSIFLMLQSSKRWKDLLIVCAEAKTTNIEDEAHTVPVDENSNDSKAEQEIEEEGATAHANRIIEQMLQAPEYYLLVGPPGTGKTSIVLHHVVEYLYTHTTERILLLSYTHRAVDEICRSLESIANMDYLRLGHSLHCHPDFHHRLLRHHIANIGNRKELQQLFDGCRIMVGTTAGFTSQHDIFNLVKFDTIIVDEASQLLEYQVIELLTHARRFFMIGDHKQLPAVTLQTNGQSLFEKLYRHALTQTPSLVGTLVYQGRMHEQLTNYANSLFYDHILRVIPLPHQQGELEYTTTGSDLLSKRLSLARAQFFDVPADKIKGRKYNTNEAKVTARIVAALSTLYRANGLVFNEKTLGIIVPYRSQISAIYNAIDQQQVEELPLINIDTVERYQGSQREIIIYSATVSTQSQLEQLSVGAICEGTLVDRKLNVIITRARKQMFVVGNRELLTTNTIYKSFIEMLEADT